MSLTLQRKVTSELMTTYFPSLLLIAITFATTFFKPDFFEAGLSVNLTNMLVMTTIFISKMEGLPPTSDIKMIDIWLILCQLVPFTQVVLLTAMEFLREGEKEEEDKQAEPGKPKYMDRLLATAKEREQEFERRQERAAQREREKEGDMYADKEKFVTSAFRCFIKCLPHVSDIL